MDLPDPLRRALERLDSAARALESAAERRAEAEAARGDAEAEHLALQDDRSRLAAELDAALARNGALERAVGEVSARVERAGEAVRGLLAAMPAAPDAAA